MPPQEITVRDLFGRFTIGAAANNPALPVYIDCIECRHCVGYWPKDTGVVTLMDAMADHFTKVHA